jgi:prefoldin subunit 5
MDELTTGGIATGSGMVGALLGWLGFKGRIKSVEKAIAEMQGVVRYEKTCDKITEGINTQLADIKKTTLTTQNDIKKLLERK